MPRGIDWTRAVNYRRAPTQEKVNLILDSKDTIKNKAGILVKNIYSKVSQRNIPIFVGESCVIPDEVLFQIFLYCVNDPITLARFSLVSKRFYKVSLDNRIWTITLQTILYKHELVYDSIPSLTEIKWGQMKHLFSILYSLKELFPCIENLQPGSVSQRTKIRILMEKGERLCNQICK